EQDDVAEPRQRAALVALAPAEAARDQDHERKVRPRGLALDPGDERIERRTDERLLGDEGDARADTERVDQLLERIADLGVHGLRLQHLRDDERIAPARRMDEDSTLQ